MYEVVICVFSRCLYVASRKHTTSHIISTILRYFKRCRQCFGAKKETKTTCGQPRWSKRATGMTRPPHSLVGPLWLSEPVTNMQQLQFIDRKSALKTRIDTYIISSAQLWHAFNTLIFSWILPTRAGAAGIWGFVNGQRAGCLAFVATAERGWRTKDRTMQSIGKKFPIKQTRLVS